MILFLFAFGLHLSLIVVVLAIRAHRVNRAFTIWLLGCLAIALTELLLRWARLPRAFQRIELFRQVFWWIAIMMAILLAARHRSLLLQRVIGKGLLAMAILTLVTRLSTGFGLIRTLDRPLYLVMNASYMLPSLYLIVALIAAHRQRVVPEWELRIADLLHECRLECSDCAQGRNCPACLHRALVVATFSRAKFLREWEPKRKKAMVISLPRR